MQTNKLARFLGKQLQEGPSGSAEELAAMIALCRQQDGEMVDRVLAEVFHGAAASQKGFLEMVEQLTAPPWYPATFMGLTECGQIEGAMVLTGNSYSVVRAAPGVELGGLRPGDEVYLGHERNLLVSSAPQRRIARGEVAMFTRRAGEDAVLVRSQDREQLVRVGGTLDASTLRNGDTVLVDFVSGIALDKVDPETDHPFFLEELPENLGPEMIGGQRKNLDQVLFALRTMIQNKGLAARYGLGGRQTILLHGPPGTGKTLMVKIAASAVARDAGKRCLFANVKPSQFESAYVGETQRNIREFFQVLRLRSEESMVVCFFDEVEGMGRIRGNHSGHHSDKFLAALLAEIEGFEGKSDFVLISASNRKDLLDPALLQRLSEIEVEIKRPTLEGAREILGIHFPPALPFSPNGPLSEVTRRELIDAAVGQLYAPNGENEIVRIRFQDAKERTVRAAELVSGRILEQISKHARNRAMRREAERGESGIRLEDVNVAVGAAMEKMRTMVTLQSAHAYLVDLPQDVTVVSVEPVRRADQDAMRYELT